MTLHPEPQPKLVDVAKLAGVSPATVSRFINKSGFVAEATAERIGAAIAELDYVPNLAAGSLVTRRSRLVAVLVPVLAQSLFNGTVQSLIAALSRAGFTPILGLTGFEQEETLRLTDAMLSRRPDAFILTGVISEVARQRLRKARVTVIETWDLPDDPIDIAIGFSHRSVGQAIAEYLIHRGYLRPFIVTTRRTRSTARREGFMSAWPAEKAGDIQETEVESPATFSQARRVFREWLHASPRPDVIVCGSDGLAQGLAVEALAAGIAVPDQLAIVGFGDIGVAADMRPSLTTIGIDGEKIGEEAARILIARENGQEVPERVIDVGFRLIERESA